MECSTENSTLPELLKVKSKKLGVQGVQPKILGLVCPRNLPISVPEQQRITHQLFLDFEPSEAENQRLHQCTIQRSCVTRYFLKHKLKQVNRHIKWFSIKWLTVYLLQIFESGNVTEGTNAHPMEFSKEIVTQQTQMNKFAWLMLKFER